MRNFDLPPRGPLNKAGFAVIFFTAMILVLVTYEVGLAWSTALSAAAIAGAIGGPLLAHRYRPWYVGLPAGFVAALGSVAAGRAILAGFSTSLPIIAVVIFCTIGFLPGMVILIYAGAPRVISR